MPDEKKVKPVEDSKKEVVSEKTPSEIKKPVRRKKKACCHIKSEREENCYQKFGCQAR
jgi:hypothetical protein